MQTKLRLELQNKNSVYYKIMNIVLVFFSIYAILGS